MNLEEDDFIARILAHPRETDPRREYADWLKSRGDLRGDYLRAEAAWAGSGDPESRADLDRQAAALDPVWVARVSRPPVGVCANHIRFSEVRQYDRPPPRLGRADLDWFESRFQLRLPPDYRGFLLNQNGGYPDPSGIRFAGRSYPGTTAHDLWYLHAIWKAAEPEIDSEEDLVWSLMHLERIRSDGYFSKEETLRWRTPPLGEVMIIGRGNYGFPLEWYCLGCRGRAMGRVFAATPYIDEEVGDDDHCEIAPSFAAMLALVREYGPVTAG